MIHLFQSYQQNLVVKSLKVLLNYTAKIIKTKLGRLAFLKFSYIFSEYLFFHIKFDKELETENYVNRALEMLPIWKKLRNIITFLTS